MDEITSRFPAPLWVLASLVLGISFWKARDRYVARVAFVVPLLLLFYAVLGNVNLWLLQDEAHLYPRAEPYGANVDAMIGTLGLVVIIAPAFSREVELAPKRVLDYTRLTRVVLFASAATFVINMINFAQAGGIPILRGDLAGDERFTIADSMVLPQALVLSSGLLAMNLIALLDRKRWGATRVHLMCAPVNLLMAAGIGSRHLVLVPFVVALLYTAYTKRVANRWIVAGMLALPIVSVGQQVLRGEESYEIIAQSGSEYRDYLLLEDEFQFHDFQHGATITPVVTNAIPKQILAIAGINKSEISKYSAFLMMDVWGAEVGIRTGIWGEFFINWGGTGTIVGLIIFGIAVVLLDRAILKRRNDEVAMLFLAFLAAMVLFAVIGSWASIGDSLGTYGLLFFALSRVRGLEAAPQPQPS